MPFNGVNSIGTFGDTKSPIETFIVIPKRNYINKQTHFLINNNNIIEKKKTKPSKSIQDSQLPKDLSQIYHIHHVKLGICTITQAKRDFKKIFKKAH